MKDAATAKWNYRVIGFHDPASGECWEAIHEVHYNESGKPVLYSESPAAVMSHDNGGTRAELGLVLDRMRDALSKPVLIESDFHSEPSADAPDQDVSEARQQDEASDSGQDEPKVDQEARTTAQETRT